MKFKCVCLAVLFGVTLIASRPLVAADNSVASWKDVLRDRIPEYGHRNWIVVADSAYPLQTSPGIETIVADADHFQVLQTVFEELGKSKHVKPVVYTDREAQFLEEDDAPGISAYREQLSDLLRDTAPTVLSHEQIISKLDQVSHSFRVLIIKTNMTVPYTSVFLQLDCAYWSPEAERKLRSAIAKHPTK